MEKLKTSLTLLATALISIMLHAGCDSTRNSEKPNILLIVVDDLGYADFSPFGNHSPNISTPNIQRIADAGVTFTQAYTTAPVCSPSRAGLNTGKLQFRWDKKASWNPGLPDNIKTIAEYLKDAGYTTAKIGKSDFGGNYFKFNVREYPLNHGYDYFLGFSAHAHDYWLTSQKIAERTPDPNGTSAHLGPLMQDTSYKSYPDDEYLTDIFTNEAIKYMAKKKDKPFFLTLSYNAVHHIVHEVPKKYSDKYDIAPIHNYDPDSLEIFAKFKPGSYAAYYEKYTRIGAINSEDMRKYYLANLNSLDDNIGRLLDAMKNNGLDENTMIVFISDNGGSPITGANNTPLSAGKYSLWEGGIRVPMMLTWPGKAKAGKTEKEYVSATDILPTIAEAAGIDPNDQTLDGRSLLHPDNDRLLVWRWGNKWAVRKGKWKLTNTNESWGKGVPSHLYIKPISNDSSIKLFDLEKDPGERNNLAGANTDIVKRLQADYESWVEENTGKF
ncbi:MAG: sulfatase [Bacteroidales bacterium]